MSTERNLCSISNVAIKENDLLDIQIVQMREKQYETFTANVMMVSTPQLRHGEEEYVGAKTQKFDDISDFDAYEIVAIPKNSKTTGTEWVSEDVSFATK